MCGIAGFYGFRDDNLIKKISKEVAHRGPDGEGYFIDDEVTLLNRRLAIIDREGGDQPIYNEDKTIVVIYNGEIYNYQSLREDLEKQGHRFSTNSDTEVIVHGYEEWGEVCFDKFNGMFAIALYDLKNKRLVLARDHFGIKPLYYSILEKTGPAVRQPQNLTPDKVVGSILGAPRLASPVIIFASEIKPIINSGLVVKEPNDRIIYRYLMYRVHDDNEETFFKNVYRLIPGQTLIVQNSPLRQGFGGQAKLEIKNYTNLKEELLSGSRLHSNSKISYSSSGATRESEIEKQTEEFRNKLIEAVRLRLISEVPVGTCLSGGLDSSAVVSIVNKLLKEKVKESGSVGDVQKTFSAVFPNSINNEEKYIDEVVKGLKQSVKNYKVLPQPEKFFEEIEEFIKTQEEPTISTGPYAQYKVMEEAHKYVTVLLDGQGADEMLAGYLPYYFTYLHQLRREKKYLQFIKELLSSLDVVTKYINHVVAAKAGIKKNIPISSLLNKNFIDEFKEEKFTAVKDDLKKRLVEDIFYHSLPSLLRYEDKNSMRFSIEGRVPFLDINLLRYIFSLSDKAIINNGWNKNILRQAVAKLLPQGIAKRRNKIGFTTPEHEWFLRMKNRIYYFFLSESFIKRKYFNQSAVVFAFEKFIAGKSDDTLLFWRLINLEMWLRIFFDPATPKPGQRKNRSMFSPNPGKELKISIDLSSHPKLVSGSHEMLKQVQHDNFMNFFRFPIKTSLFKKGDNVAKVAMKFIKDFFVQFEHKKQFQKLQNKKWFIVISEKIIAIAQGRSYFIWDMKPGFWAKTLSKYVTRTPFGIGLGSPWTMQLAINEVGAVRVMAASLLGILGRLVGVRGLFYVIAGGNVRAIDGPTEYSLYPSNVSAKLPPKNPKKVALEIHQEFVKNFPKTKAANFEGVVIIDANDLGRNILGNSTKYKDSLIEEIFKDNPMGQGSEQTPIVLVVSS